MTTDEPDWFRQCTPQERAACRRAWASIERSNERLRTLRDRALARKRRNGGVRKRKK